MSKNVDDKLKFEMWGHGGHNTTVGVVEGDTIGAIIDEALKRFAMSARHIHAFKIEINGAIIKLKRSSEAVQ